MVLLGGNMEPRLKALLKKLENISIDLPIVIAGTKYSGMKWISIGTVKKLVKKYWPAIDIIHFIDSIDRNEKLNNFEPKQKRNRTQEEAAISSGCSLHIYKKRFDAMKTKNNWPASWSSPEFENWPTLKRKK